MALTLSTSGTISALGDTIATHRDTVEERHGYDTLVYEDALAGNAAGFPELEQFIGIIAKGYGISALAAAVHIQTLLTVWMNRGRVPDERQYTP